MIPFGALFVCVCVFVIMNRMHENSNTIVELKLEGEARTGSAFSCALQVDSSIRFDPIRSSSGSTRVELYLFRLQAQIGMHFALAHHRCLTKRMELQLNLAGPMDRPRFPLVAICF